MKPRNNRWERQVERRSRLSHFGTQGLALLWGRRFRLPANFTVSHGRGSVALGIVLAGLLLAPACGYHVGGQAALIPDTIHTISVSAFGNATVRNTLARLLPDDITREFHTRTRYTIVSDPAQADAVLTGTLTNFNSMGTTTDPVTGRATSAQVVVALQVTLTERKTGKVLYTQPHYEFRERYEVATDPKVYFDESGTAIERVARDVAHSVVSAILEAF